jgi:hypothetical protein
MRHKQWKFVGNWSLIKGTKGHFTPKTERNFLHYLVPRFSGVLETSSPKTCSSSSASLVEVDL